MVDETNPIDALAQCCEEEYARFFRNLQAESRCCFDLARSALKDRVQDAMTHFYRIYQPLCAGWVAGFGGFQATGEPSPDVFVNMGFARLLTRLSPETFERFDSLSAILAYLKKCVITSVLQQLRRPAAEELEQRTQPGKKCNRKVGKRPLALPNPRHRQNVECSTISFPQSCSMLDLSKSRVERSRLVTSSKLAP